MELPEDCLKIIKEYAQPVTRPDWRLLRIMPNQRFYLELMKLKDEWWKRDKMYWRRPVTYDKLMRKYILRYRIHLLAEFEWDSSKN